MPFFAGGQPEVDEECRRVVADRVPVLSRAVERQRLGARIEVDRIDVGEVAALLRILEVLVEQVDGAVDILADQRIAGDPEGLGRAGERVDLLVRRNRVVVVAEDRCEIFRSRPP